MKKNSSLVALVLIVIVLASVTSVKAEKFEWDYNVNTGASSSREFFVTKDNQFIQLTVEVHQGGPINIFVFNNQTFLDWNDGFPATPDGFVIALFGEANITEGTKITIDGYLGPAFNYTVESISIGEETNTYNGTETLTTTLYNVRTTSNYQEAYYVIVDNRSGDRPAIVSVTAVSTVDAANIVSALGGIILVALVFSKRKKWKKSPF